MTWVEPLLRFLDGLATIFGRFGAVVVVFGVLAAIVYAFRLILEHGIKGLELFMEPVKRIWETVDWEIRNIADPAICVELILECFLLLVILPCLAIFIVDILVPTPMTHAGQTVLAFLTGASVVFCVLLGVSMKVAVSRR